jgi:hypothetical protein
MSLDNFPDASLRLTAGLRALRVETEQNSRKRRNGLVSGINPRHCRGFKGMIFLSAHRSSNTIWPATQSVSAAQIPDVGNRGLGRHVQQATQIREYRAAAWKEAGHKRDPRVSVSRSIFALVDDRDRAYFGGAGDGAD